MNRRRFLGSTASIGAALLSRPYIGNAAAKEVLIAEPNHIVGYLPLYIAMAKGLFEDVEVKLVTIETGGGHTNAVLSGQAFAFIGGPEHDAFAKIKGAELRSVVNCVNRGSVYFCAAKGQEPTNTDWPSFFKGKRVAVGPFGGTPNSIMRYLLKTWNLDPKKDLTLIETASSATIAVVRSKQARSARRRSRMSRRGCATTSGASRSSARPRNSGLTPIPPSTSGSKRFRKSRSWCGDLSAAWSKA